MIICLSVFLGMCILTLHNYHNFFFLQLQRLKMHYHNSLNHCAQIPDSWLEFGNGGWTMEDGDGKSAVAFLASFLTFLPFFFGVWYSHSCWHFRLSDHLEQIFNFENPQRLFLKLCCWNAYWIFRTPCHSGSGGWRPETRPTPRAPHFVLVWRQVLFGWCRRVGLGVPA